MQPQGATSVIQAITDEGLAQGPYVAARGGVEPHNDHIIVKRVYYYFCISVNAVKCLKQ